MSLGFTSCESSLIKRVIRQISWIGTFLLESIKIKNIKCEWQPVSFHNVFISVLYVLVLVLVYNIKWVICCGSQFKIQKAYTTSLP